MKRLFLLFFTVFLFFSCSDTEPKITAINPCLLFEYKTMDSLPEFRLSVFAVCESDYLRASKFVISNPETALEWECKEFRRFTDDKKSWIGYSNFIMHSQDLFPAGKYEFYYEDLAEKEFKFDFYVRYPSEIAECKASEVESKIKMGKSQKYALYNAEGDLLFYGDKKSTWKDFSKIKSEFPTAVKLKKCWSINSNSVLIVMPEESLEDKDNN